MRPQQGFAIDILFQKTFAQHQAKVLARAPPWRIRRLVDDMPKVIETPRVRRLAVGNPSLARLSTLPGACRKPENFHLHRAPFQGPRENVGTHCCDTDRPATHGTGIVDQQRHDRIAELHVLLFLEGQRMKRVDDDPIETAGIQQPLFQVELPRSRLLRHQAALQAVCKLADQTLEIHQLLVEQLPKPREFLGVT